MASLYGTGNAPKTEILINGTWTDYSSRVRADQAISITRGRADQQSNVSAQTCNLTLDNRDGLFSNRNPNSALYGLLPRNTNIRVSAGPGDQYLKTLYTDPTAIIGAITVDKTALDITGDIDIRVDVLPHIWRGRTMILASKWSASSQQSWVFFLSHDGTLQFRWTTGGTSATARQVFAGTPVAPSGGRLALRVTMDVDNGASNSVITFYIAPTLAGPWTSIAAPTGGGVTSIYNSTSALTVAGGATDTQAVFGDSIGFGGKLYGFELRNGINGTVVAKVDPLTLAVGQTTWTEGTAPNVWTLQGAGARITSDRFRFAGEMSSLPQTWDPTTTNITVPVTAAGLIRRLGRNNTKVASAMAFNFMQYANSGYWPLEDQANSGTAAGGLPRTSPARVHNVSFGNGNGGLNGAATVVTFSDGGSRISGNPPLLTATGQVSFVVYMRINTLPTTSKAFASFGSTGLARSTQIALSPTTWDISFYAADGSLFTTSSTPISGIDPSKGWVGINILLKQNGPGLDYYVRWDPVGTSGAGGIGPFNLSTNGTAGVPTGFVLTAENDSAYQAASFGHVFLSGTNFDLTSDAFRNASNAWLNETAVARMTRMAAAYGEPLEVTGLAADSSPMGYQPVDSFLNVMYDCWATDGGIGGECRDVVALSYRTRADLELRSDVTYDLVQSHLSEVPTPTEDDTGFTNDVTASRPNVGTSQQVVIIEGGTSIQDPPNGVGDYPTGLTVNVNNDASLASAAGWAALTGSWDEARFPNIAVALHRSQIFTNDALFYATIALELGDTINMINLPSFLPPGGVYELIQGYSEQLSKFMWSMTFNCTPAGPYRSVGRLGTDFNAVPRLDSTQHTSSGTMTTTSTSITLVTPGMSARWVDSANFPAEFPFDIKMAGEVMTVTAISGTSSPQTATVTRSVNGIVKTHADGELVRLASPNYLGR